MGIEQLAPFALPALGGLLQWLASRSKQTDAVTTAWLEDREELKQLRHDYSELREEFDILKEQFGEVSDVLKQNILTLQEKDRIIAVQAENIVNLEAENAKLKAAGGLSQ